MSDNPYRQWNGAQWMVWDGAQWQPERQPYQPAKPISDGRRALRQLRGTRPGATAR